MPSDGFSLLRRDIFYLIGEVVGQAFAMFKIIIPGAWLGCEYNLITFASHIDFVSINFKLDR